MWRSEISLISILFWITPWTEAENPCVARTGELRFGRNFSSGIDLGDYIDGLESDRSITLSVNSSTDDFQVVGNRVILNGEAALQNSSTLTLLCSYAGPNGNITVAIPFTVRTRDIDALLDPSNASVANSNDTSSDDPLVAFAHHVEPVDKPKNRIQRQLPPSLVAPPPASVHDKPPSFQHPDCRPFGGVCADVEYTINIQPGLVPGIQPLQVQPKSIEARDLEYNKAIIYKFINGTPSNYEVYFFMDPISGAVSQVRPVPFGEADNFSIYFSAKEDGLLGLSSVARIVIHVDNAAENLHDPVLESSGIHGYIDENSEIGTTVRLGPEQNSEPLQILVTDEDLKPGMAPATYQYVLMGIGASVFAVNQGGYVYLNMPTLDADGANPRTYALTIQAREVGTAPIRSSQPLSIKIDVIDANDNEPTFERQVFQAHAAADVVMQDILKIQAKDGDAGKNGEMQYNLVSVTNNGERIFRYNKDTHHLVSIAPMKEGDQYQILLQATDGGGKSGQAIIVVEVVSSTSAATKQTATPTLATIASAFQDSKSSLPARISGPRSPIYNVTVSESIPIGSVVARIGGDGHEKLQYTIVKGNEDNKFRLDSETGAISTVASLDREATSTYQITIQAVGATTNETVTVMLTVQDENDNAPTFNDAKPIRFLVDDGSVANTFVGQLHAEDPDAGSNGVLKLSIDPDSPSAAWFSLDPNDGTIKAKTILRTADKPVHYLRIVARDGGAIPHETGTEVEIHVVDKTESQPIFVNDNYIIEIDENVGPHELVRVEAKTPSGQGPVTYVLKQGDPTLFAVDSATGTVSTLANLDAERRRPHSLIIGTRENNDKSPGATANIEVRVKDINDWIPIFRPQSYSATVSESAKVGASILQVTAFDQDAEEPNNVIRYRLAGDDEGTQFFAVDPSTGEISVKRPLKALQNKEIALLVEAADGGSPPLSSTATATIQIGRPGDTSPQVVERPIVAPDEPRLPVHIATMPPIPKASPNREMKFSSTKYSTSVIEGADVAGFLQVLQVENKPSSLLGVQCSVLSGNYGGVFSINANSDGDCELRLRGILDRETVDHYVLNVSVSSPLPNDRNQVDFCQVIVQVLDVNDNTPRFVFDSESGYHTYFAALAPEKPAGTKIVAVQAVDADAEGNNRIIYSLDSSNSDSQYFSINSNSGEIKSTKMLPERGQIRGQKPYFEFHVLARDSPINGQPLSSKADVVVNLITDSNRFVMTLDGIEPSSVDRYIPEIKRSVQSGAGECKTVGIESIHESHDLDTPGTDIVLYAIDPATKTICRHDEFGTLFEKSNVDRIKGELSGWLNVRRLKQLNAGAQDQVLVAGVGGVGDENVGGGLFSQNRWQAAEIALVVLGCIIVVGTLIGIMAMCYFWSRYKSSRIVPTDRMQLYSALPKYNALILPASEKEYETQIMEMAVPGDRTLEKGMDPDFSLDEGIYSMHTASKMDIFPQRHVPPHVYIPPPDYPSNGHIGYGVAQSGRRSGVPAPAHRKRNSEKTTIL